MWAAVRLNESRRLIDKAVCELAGALCRLRGLLRTARIVTLCDSAQLFGRQVPRLRYAQRRPFTERKSPLLPAPLDPVSRAPTVAAGRVDAQHEVIQEVIGILSRSGCRSRQLLDRALGELGHMSHWTRTRFGKLEETTCSAVEKPVNSELVKPFPRLKTENSCASSRHIPRHTNGIHEVSGSIPLGSTNLKHP